jgi:phage repressor protein C with HTH and peptisase S24 domain
MFDKNINQVGLAEILGISQSSMSKIVKGERSLQEHHLDKLIEKFGKDVVNNYYNHQNLETPSKMESTIMIYDSETLEEIKQEIEEAESFPVLPEDVSTSPNTDILKYVEENGAELETINPNQLLLGAKVDVAERIKRTSMLPTFQPEDAVFIRFIKDKMKIVDGETYYLDCKNRPTMIRLVKFEPDGKLRLIAKNSQYGDIVIERSDVINIGVVVALFRMTFGDQYSELEELRREKEAEREKKDLQIDKMLEMMQAQGEQQSKLIDFITKEK